MRFWVRQWRGCWAAVAALVVGPWGCGGKDGHEGHEPAGTGGRPPEGGAPAVAGNPGGGSAGEGGAGASAPLVTTGVATGVVTDAEGAPLGGVRIEQLGGASVSSAATGRFQLELAATAEPTLLVTAAGYAPLERHVDLAARRVALGPILLVPVAAAEAVDGADGGTVAGDGVTVEVPAGAWTGSVEVTVAVIPVGDPLLDDDRFPRALPRPPGGQLAPLFGVIVDTSGVQPREPVAITVTTAAALPTTAKVPVGRYARDTGEWVDVGLASVTSGGALRFTTHHLSTFAGGLPALPTVPTRPPALARLDELPSLTLPGEPRVDVRTGGLLTGLELPTLIRRDARVELTLFHDSRSLIPAMPVPVTVTDAAPGETLLVRADTPYAALRAESAVADDLSAGQAATMTLPGTQGSTATAAADPAVSSATVTVGRPTAGTLHASASASFAAPTLGSALTSGATPVATPAPIAVESTATGAVPFDDRSASPFGPGWHLQGLTRLLQPQCNRERPVLLGRYEDPGKVYRPPDLAYVTPLTQALTDGGLDPAALAGEDVQVARTASATFVALGNAGELWRVGADGAAATQELALADRPELGSVIWGTARAAADDGVVLATEHTVVHVPTSGEPQPLAGSATGAAPVEGGDAATTNFGGLAAVAVNPTSGDLVVSTFTSQTWAIRDGALSQVRTRTSHPHGLIMAFDPAGALHYTAPGSPCVYRHVDGLTDPPDFADCSAAGTPALLDGPASSAGVRDVSSLAFDDAGAMVVVDGLHGAVRRLAPDGTVTTLSRPLAASEARATTGLGGPAGDALLATAQHVSAAGSGELVVGTPEGVIELGPPPGVLLGPGDGAVLRAHPDGTWTRELASGTVETYDRRGLLTSRGKVGEPQIEYEYADWSVAEDAEVCGEPPPVPHLSAITLRGETLFAFTYDGDRLTSVTDAADRTTTLTWYGGRPTSFDLPGQLQALSFEYDDAARITKKTTRGAGGLTRETTYTYGDGGLLEATLPGRAPLTYSALDAATAPSAAELGPTGITRHGRLTVAQAVIPGRAGSAKVELSTTGLRVTSAGSDVSELEVDGQGRLAALHYPDGTALGITRDPAGRIVELRNPTSGEVWSYTYDRGSGRLSQESDPLGGLARWDWDRDGRVTLAVAPDGGHRAFTYDTSGATSHGLPVRITDTLNRPTTLDYDAQGNVTDIVAPGGATTHLERDPAGRVTRLEEPTGVVRTFGYDARDGHLEESWGEDALARTTTFARQVTDAWTAVEPDYPASILTGVTDASGRAYTLERDVAYRLTRLTAPATGETTQVFDARGLLLRVTTADDAIEHLTVDADGRLTRRTFEGATAGQELALAYDALGRVERAEDTYVVESRSFEPGLGWHRVDVAAQAGQDTALTFSLERSRLSATTTTLSLTGSTFAVTRGANGLTSRVAHESDAAPTWRDVWTATYDGEARPLTIARGNGTESRARFDAEGRLTRQEEVHAGGTLTIDWTWDAAGRPLTRTLGGVTRTYGYDAHGQLASCSDTAEAYTYDAVGARAATGADPVVRGSRGELVSDATYTYTYDVRGRRTTRTSRTDAAARTEYVWGPQGLLASVRQGPAASATTVASYLYDGNGRRIQRTVGADRWLYGYLPDTDRVVRVVTPDDTVWHLLHATPSAAFTVAIASTGAELYVHTDPLGGVVGVSNELGELTLLDEDCYGVRRTALAVAPALDVGFHGLFFDPETALYAAGPRSYDPLTGELLSPDPAGLAGGFAPWTYAGGNPAVQQDPSGRLFFVAIGAAIAGYKVYGALRDLAQSAEVKRAKQSYADMTNVDDPDALARAEEAHTNLSAASKQGGKAALKATKEAYSAVLSPTTSAQDVVDTVKDELVDTVKEAAEKAAGGESDDTSFW